MLKEAVVKIIANRIMNKGINPKTMKVFVIGDVKHEGYKTAIEAYILNNSSQI